MPKTSKTQSKPKKQAAKPHVVSFRLTDPQYTRLKKTSDETKVLGASSPRQFARKLVCDFLNGKLHYKNPKDLRVDLEAYA